MFIDLSHTVEHGMITYKGLPSPVISDFMSREASRSHYAEGTEFNIAKIDMVANTGTYLDSPFHRYARGKDLEVVGFYHSHPDSPAVPSQYDLDHAWPTYSYIIVSTTADQAKDLFSWEQEPDRSRFNQEELVVATK